MLKVNKWVDDFEELTPNNQIKITKAIKDKISFNMLTVEKYDEELGKILVEFFANITDYIKGSETLSRIKSIIPRFYKLPKERQYNVLRKLVKYIEKQEKDEIEFQKKEECKNNGHDYSEWEKILYSTVEQNPYLGSRDYIVPEGMEYISVEHKKWTRTCKRCGYVEEVYEEPQSVKDARIKQEKEEEIKFLQKKIDELKKK